MLQGQPQRDSTRLGDERERELDPAPSWEAPGRASSVHDRLPRGLANRRRVRDAQLYVPAAVAALSSYTLGGASADAAVRAFVLGSAILAFALLLRGVSFPWRLVGSARVVLALLPSFAGGLIVGLLAVPNPYGLAATELVSAVALAALAALAVEAASDRLLSRRPLRIAVLGSPSFASALRGELEDSGDCSAMVVGWLNLGGRFERESARERLFHLDRVRSVVTKHEIDLLVRGPSLTEVHFSNRTYEAIAEDCVDLPVRMIDGNSIYEELFGHVPLGTIDANWFLYLMHPAFEGTSRTSKRVVDIVGAALALVLTAPLLLLAAVAIRLGDGGRVFYRQTRVGEGGRPFRIYKLRTMRIDAEWGGAQWSVAADDRATRVGRVLRRMHLDEVPQAINVLRGQMTLVGPRPERPEIIAELERLFPHYKRRLLIKPGVTGWAQVHCGYAGTGLGTAWKLCHDLYYLKHRSILGDLLIMVETLVIAARDSHRPLRSPTPGLLFDAAQARGVVIFEGKPAAMASGPAGPPGPELGAESPAPVALLD